MHKKSKAQKRPRQGGPPNVRAALGTLQDRGAHFVLCDGKRPVWRRWQKRRPGIDLVLSHGPELGLIPYSIGTSALDVDWGELGELVDATEPMVVLPTPRGSHLYYTDTRGRGNCLWSAHGCGGDVRSAQGFLRLYESGPERLVGALTTGRGRPFPADLFEAVGVYVPTVAVEKPRCFEVKAPEDLLPLQQTEIGTRADALFDHLRFWAYPCLKGPGLEGWKARVLEKGESWNLLMPDPLGTFQGDDRHAVRDTAYSVATWTWAGGGPIDHSPAAQSRRGIKSGRARRLRTRERDRHIVGLAIQGETQAAISKALNVPQQTVSYVIR